MLDYTLTVRACETFHQLITVHFSQIKLTFYRNSIAFIIINFQLNMLALHRCWDFFFSLRSMEYCTLSFNLDIVVSQFLNPLGFSFQKVFVGLFLAFLKYLLCSVHLCNHVFNSILPFSLLEGLARLFGLKPVLFC